MKKSKRYLDITNRVDRLQMYELDDAIKLVRDSATAKFDESVEISVNLGVDPRHADQMVRGTVSFPHGTGKTVRVLVITDEGRWDEAKEAGADHVGLDEMVAKIQEGWLDFDSVIATPNVMGKIGRLGKILGPRGLMPNPKVGTVTNDLGSAVKEIKAGRVDFRVDKYGIMHVAVGKGSFDENKLRDNILAFLDKLVKLRPAAIKGTYVKAITLASTMGPGVRVDRQQALGLLK